MILKRLLKKKITLAAIIFIGIALPSCAPNYWRTFRHDASRSGYQADSSAISDPAKVPGLHVRWTFQPPGPQMFRASPVVYNGRVYIGNANGYFYAVNADTGALDWQYPAAASPALVSQFTCNPSSFGIASSAAIATINGTDAVIFGAPDQSIGTGLGEGRLFALNAQTGAEIWKSPVIAHVTGLTVGSTTQLHEQIGYSAALVFNDRVYVGIANHCDNPIQNGKVVAVSLTTGAIDAGFSFTATNTRGGGVWSSIAGFENALYVTTGNSRCWNGGCQSEPTVNNALSLLRLDANTGSVIWKYQPVPFSMDNDPDWSAGATAMQASCGTVIVSTMKDGWTHAVNAGDGTPGSPSMRWVFPAHTIPFTPGDGTVHGDTRYLRPGAAWGDVYITITGGLNVTTNVTGGYRRLHALNVCAAEADRIRWIKDVPGATGTYALGPPTVTRGMVYVGTNSGRLIVIADPSIAPAAGWRCSNPDVSSANCVASGFTLVPDPAVLADIQLDGSIRTEPALLAQPGVYVATDSGKLYRLDP